MNSEILSARSDPKGLVVRYDAITYRDHEIEFLSDPAGVQKGYFSYKSFAPYI